MRFLDSKLPGTLILFSLALFGGYLWWQNRAESSFTVNKTLENRLTSGLVGHWTFDGPDMLQNVADVSGQGNHGNLQGQTSTTTAPGKLGQALEFDGVDDYVDVGDINELDGVSVFTLNAWVKFDSLTDYSAIVAKSADLDNQTEMMIGAPGDGGGNDDAYLVVEKDLSGGAQAYGWTTGDIIKTGVWGHWTMVYDGNQTGNVDRLKFYFNGIQQTLTFDGTIPALTDSNSAPVLIGSLTVTSDTFDGLIDDVRIYNRALSADEIKALYDGTKGSHVNTTRTDRLTDGLVGHWTFDGPHMLQNVADVSGQGNHGNLIGQTSTTTAPGRLGQALEFDGVDDRIDVTDNSLSFAPNKPFSISGWAKMDDATNFTIVGRGIDATAEIEYKLAVDSNDVLLLRLYDDTGSKQIHSVSDDVLTSYEGQWIHVAGTYDGSGSHTGIDVYLNGVRIAQTQSSAGTYFAMSNVGVRNEIGAFISQDDSGFDSFADGLIDDVRIYDRALSAEEIKALYDGTKGSHVNTTRTDRLTDGLVGHWTFDGPHMLTNVADVSGQGNHGNLIGQTSTTTAPGKIGQALEFDGVDDLVRVPYDASLGITGDIAITAWIKRVSFDRKDEIVIKTNGTTQWDYEFSTANTAFDGAGNVDKLVFYVDQPGFTAVYSTGTIADTAWHHVAVTRSGSAVTFYIDGVSSGGGTISGSFANNSIPVGVGGSVGDQFLNGTLDDVRIYNRALSAEEIKELYNMGRN